jgi:peroxiredoxin
METNCNDSDFRAPIVMIVLYFYEKENTFVLYVPTCLMNKSLSTFQRLASDPVGSKVD